MRSNIIAARAWFATARRLRWLAAGMVLAVSSGCQDMYDQHRYEPFEASTFFDDGSSSRPLVAGTVARTDPRGLPDVPDRDLLLTGLKDGQPSPTAPFPIDRAALERGQERYRIYCAPCHGEVGDGKGIVVQRGFTTPPSYHDDRLRDAPLGHFFQVISQGHGAMYSFAARVAPQDRWKIAGYIRALQLSQNAKASELPAADQGKLQESSK